jgi:hypothetical protein
MYPAIPAEMINAAVQLAIYFITGLGAVLSFMLAVRG